MEDTKAKTIQDLPEEVIDFLSSFSVFDYAEDFFKKYSEGKGEVKDMIQLCESVAINEIKFDQLPSILTEKLNVTKSMKEQAVVDFATHRLFPIAGVIGGDVAGQIVRWGGKLEDLKEIENIVLPEMSAEEFSSKVAEDLKLQFQEENEYKRFASIITSNVKGIRDTSETLETFTKSRKVGGLEMDKVTADLVLSYLKDKLAFLKISTKEVQPTMTDVRAPQAAPVGFEGPVVLRQGWKDPVQEEVEEERRGRGRS